MATLVLPTFRAFPDHRYTVLLDGETFTLEFHLNKRANRWSMHVFDVEGNAVRHGIKLVEGIDLLQRISVEGRPPGEIRVADPTEDDTEPTETNLGVDTSFRYVEAE